MRQVLVFGYGQSDGSERRRIPTQPLNKSARKVSTRLRVHECEQTPHGQGINAKELRVGEQIDRSERSCRPVEIAVVAIQPIIEVALALPLGRKARRVQSESSETELDRASPQPCAGPSDTTRLDIPPEP
jgi:hypothetical protein